MTDSVPENPEESRPRIRAYVDGVERPVEIVIPQNFPPETRATYLKSVINFLSLPVVRAGIVTLVTSVTAFFVDRAREKNRIQTDRAPRRRKIRSKES
jgi:uncharacterized membrane protein